MAGMIPIGELETASDRTTGSLIDRPVSQSQQAVDRRVRDQITPAVYDVIAGTNIVSQVTAAAVTNELRNRNILIATNGNLPDGTDFNDIKDVQQAGTYTLVSTFTYKNAPPIEEGAVLRVSIGNSANAVVQEVMAGDRSHWREAWGAAAGQWSGWNETQKVADTPLPVASQLILELARSDGWRAVYDPSNPATRLTAEGKIVSIGDGLGNLPVMSAGNVPSRPALKRAGIGSLDVGEYGLGGVANALRTGTLSTAQTQPTFLLTIAQSRISDVGENSRYILDGETAGGRNAILASATSKNQWASYAGNEFMSRDAALDTSPHVLGAQFAGVSDSRFFVDGVPQYGAWAVPGVGNNHAMSGLTVGNRFSGSGSHWEGMIGPVLVYNGTPPDDVRDRMTRLLQALATGAGRVRTDQLNSLSALMKDKTGNPQFSKEHTTLRVPASLTKMITAVLARQTITNARLDELVTVLSSDSVGGSSPALQVGDQLTYRDLFYLVMGPSHNRGSEILGRAVGAQLSGSGTASEKFIAAMNAMVQSWGWTGAVFTDTSGLSYDNRMTALQASELLYRIADNDTTLLGIMGTISREVQIVGTNARTLTSTHTINPVGDVPLPEFVAGKTGTLGFGNVAMLIRKSDGGLRSVVTMVATPASERFVDARKIIDGRATALAFRGPDVVKADNEISRAVADETSRTRALMDRTYEPITRGTLPSGTDLNNLTGAQSAGTWRLAASNVYYNLPVNSLVGAAVLHVKITDNGNGQTQEMELGTAKYFRKSVILGSWYAWQQVVVRSMLDGYTPTSRGTLATAMDLDTLTSPAAAGAYHLAAANTYTGLPEGFVMSEACVLRVDAGNALNAVAQTLIHHTADRLDMWVRELRVAANVQNPRNSWQPWKRIPTADEIADLIGQTGGGIVRSAQVTRIVASNDPNAVLQDGDLLLVYGGA